MLGPRQLHGQGHGRTRLSHGPAARCSQGPRPRCVAGGDSRRQQPDRRDDTGFADHVLRRLRTGPGGAGRHRQVSAVALLSLLSGARHEVLTGTSPPGCEAAASPWVTELVNSVATDIQPGNRGQGCHVDRAIGYELRQSAPALRPRGGSRARFPLTLSALGVVTVGALLPATPVARSLGFEPLPLGYFSALIAKVLCLPRADRGRQVVVLARQLTQTCGSSAPRTATRGREPLPYG